MADINLKELLPQTRQGLYRALNSLGQDQFDGRVWILLDQLAYIYFVLRALPDKPEWFPSGKWATLQRLESLCEQAGREVVAEHDATRSLKHFGA